MKVTVVIGILTADGERKIHGDPVWLADLPDNLEPAERLRAKAGAGATVILYRASGDKDRTFLELFAEISARFPDWAEIECIGHRPGPLMVSNIIAPRGSPSGIYIAEPHATDVIASEPKFKLTRNPPAGAIDRVEIWRKNLHPKNILNMTARARDRIIEIRDVIQNQEPNKEIIPSLSWGARSRKTSHDNEWRDVGLGFTLTFFDDTRQFPAEAVEICNGIEIIFRLGTGWRRFEGKTVDYIQGGGGFVFVDDEMAPRRKSAV